MPSIRDYVLEKINEGYCIVMGNKNMINEFSKSFGIQISILMGDFYKNGEIKSEQIRVFNSDTKKIMNFAIADGMEMKNVIRMGREICGAKETDETKEEIENLLAVMLEKGNNIGIYSAKNDEEKLELINKFIRIPDEKMRDEMKKVVKNIENKDEGYIGYA